MTIEIAAHPDTGSDGGERQTQTGRLAGVPVFANLPAPEISRLERAAHWHRYRRGEQILDRDSMSRDVYFVVEGMVEVVNYSLSGREVAYGPLSTGSFF